MLFINQGRKPVFKIFSKQLEFYKRTFETQFCRLTHFTRNYFEVVKPIFGHIFRDTRTEW